MCEPLAHFATYSTKAADQHGFKILRIKNHAQQFYSNAKTMAV